ncbi:[FeFe] hydrogenase H-cluster radical SAM maturase HydE [Herbivorax sp. ANBcel31]|uniref:[FeFe] hydrogenase H-cluster radical SAM maturase HydE n=1 Tax=Herbivorax sp. ANBcel31 TaxID=3069754 RepID=UPI0027B19407|nr:[FeFe] hydrogenase H-cluster radical SAM maturase HydE [Herbivorax sp. ANBcel31]MDQ2086172.1 [FeFe] hydrogenase H-cluster radical SAM maturase HydE [Herbivorax sp. ANBcel31]
MKEKFYLILAQNSAQMLLINKLLKKEGIQTDLVPAPPESGTVCAVAIKVNGDYLEKSKSLITKNKIEIINIYEDKKMKLQGLIDKKLGLSVTKTFLNILKKIENGENFLEEEIIYLLSTKNKKEIDGIYAAADKIRKETVGNVIEIRGAIEFSNYCRKKCKYCGINSQNKIKRYRMNEKEIMEVVKYLDKIGMRTIILQSGEDYGWGIRRLTELVKNIKEKTRMRITLSVGEKSFKDYKNLKKAGADNFLLKIETTNRKLFELIHPDGNFDLRLKCSKWLKELGYINGSGNIIGIPDQTIQDIANDILYFKEMGINMIGIGPFIPARGTPFENIPHGDVNLTLRTIAVTRIVCKKVYIPSTTALASLDKHAQVQALKAGANTIMLISTPEKYKSDYKIYNNKNMIDIDAAIYASEKTGIQLPAYLKV